MEFDLDAAREIAERECGAEMGDMRAKLHAYGAALIAQTYAADDIAPAFEAKWDAFGHEGYGLPRWSEIDGASRLQIMVELGVKHMGHAMRRAGMSFEADLGAALDGMLLYARPEFEDEPDASGGPCRLR